MVTGARVLSAGLVAVVVAQTLGSNGLAGYLFAVSIVTPSMLVMNLGFRVQLLARRESDWAAFARGRSLLYVTSLPVVGVLTLAFDTATVSVTSVVLAQRAAEGLSELDDAQLLFRGRSRPLIVRLVLRSAVLAVGAVLSLAAGGLMPLIVAACAICCAYAIGPWILGGSLPVGVLRPGLSLGVNATFLAAAVYVPRGVLASIGEPSAAAELAAAVGLASIVTGASALVGQVLFRRTGQIPSLDICLAAGALAAMLVAAGAELLYGVAVRPTIALLVSALVSVQVIAAHRVVLDTSYGRLNAANARRLRGLLLALPAILGMLRDPSAELAIVATIASFTPDLWKVGRRLS